MNFFFFEKLGGIFARYNLLTKPMHIYNMDETGINVVHKSGRILTELGRKKVWALTSGEKGKTHTVVSCVSASGNVIPPMMIYPRKHMTDKLKSGAVPGTLFACSDNGWINQQLYLQWFEFFVASIPPACPVLLIEDGHASHISLEVIKLSDIHLLCLPSHTTHLLQPLDVGVFKSMKSQFNKACKHFMTSKPGRVITSEDLASLLAVTWPQCMTPVNIMSGFGIYPLNPGAVKDYETTPSKSLCFPSDSQDQEPDTSMLSPETQPPQCSLSTSEQTISECSVLLDSGSDITDPAAESRASSSSSVQSKTSVASSSNTDYLDDILVLPQGKSRKPCRQKTGQNHDAVCITNLSFVEQLKEKERKKEEMEEKKAEREEKERKRSKKSRAKAKTTRARKAKDRMTFDESESEGSTAICPLCGVDFNDDEEDAKWIGCDGCQQWWHASCLGMNDADIPDGCYYCADCAL